MNEKLQTGDTVICLESGNAYDNGNRVFRGHYYTIDRVIENNSKEGINGETVERGVLVHSHEETKRDIYPYVWNENRFTKVTI